MKSIKKLILIVTFFVASGGVAHANKKIDPAVLASIHSIGVLSALGDRIEFKSIGVTIFGNSLNYLPANDWGLDAVATAEAEKLLSGRFTVGAAPFGRDAVAHIGEGFTTYGAALGRVIRAQPPSKMDAYLILVPQNASLPYPSNQEIVGVGVYRQASLFGGGDPGATIAHIIYIAYLLDAKTGKVIGQMYGTSSATDDPGFGAYGTYPHDLTTMAWPAKFEDATDEDKLALKEQLISLLRDSIDYTLLKMGVVESPGASPSQ